MKWLKIIAAIIAWLVGLVIFSVVLDFWRGFTQDYRGRERWRD